MQDLFQLLAKNPLPYFGYNLSGQPLGLDDGCRAIKADEDLSGNFDPLIEITDQLLTRPMYFDQGFTMDKRLFLRRPALYHYLEYDQFLRENFGWRIRIADAFRPTTVQQKGFCWGVSEVVKHFGQVSLDDFLALLKRILEGSESAENVELAQKYLHETDLFFSYVPLKPYDRSLFPMNLPELTIIGAANLGLIDLELDRYGMTQHGSGGVVDMEWIDERTGRLVNVGVPVDTQGLESAFPFFEDEVAPAFAPYAAEFSLQTVEARKEYYRTQVAKKAHLQKYLAESGVEMEPFFQSENYFDQIWKEIQKNRRVVVSVAGMLGIFFFGLESWHADANDARGGIRCRKKNLVSGGPAYAFYLGQKECAWGNATRLWETL